MVLHGNETYNLFWNILLQFTGMLLGDEVNFGCHGRDSRCHLMCSVKFILALAAANNLSICH